MFIDIIGWIGSILLVAAFAYNLSGKLSTQSFAYLLLNIIGSICLIANGWYHWALPSVGINVVWVVFAGLAIYKKINY